MQELIRSKLAFLKEGSFRKAALFSLAFCIIVTAYYQVKPASRSLYITYVGSKNLPYVWIASACVLALLLPLFNWRLQRYPREQVVAGSCICFALLLVFFRLLISSPNVASVVGFYILVDVYSVVLVEQFWTLAAGSYHTAEGRRYFGLIGSGGLVGGMLGSALGAFLLANTRLKTIDLLLVAVLFIGAVLLLLRWMEKRGYFVLGELQPDEAPRLTTKTWQSGKRVRYIGFIVGLMLASQLIQPIVEFQFMQVLERSIGELKERTTYLSALFSILSFVSLAFNLTITPLVHRKLGAIAGLSLQPLAIIVSAVLFNVRPVLSIASLMKIADRGLSYSVNRASKELLYLPIDPALVSRLKAFIDMFGYRLFKVFSSLILLYLTQWLALPLQPRELSWAVVLIALLWLVAVIRLRPLYWSMVKQPVEGGSKPDKNHVSS